MRLGASGDLLDASDGVFLQAGYRASEFTQERRAKAYEAGLRKELAQRHPNLTPEQAQRYERRINELVAQFRENQAQQQQQAQPLPTRSQEQGGIEPSR